MVKIRFYDRFSAPTVKLGFQRHELGFIHCRVSSGNASLWQVKTSLQTFTLRNDNDQPVFVQRQKTAFPPNFIHSLDSAHMMMTALECGQAGLLFAGVHDSFWTHARDVDEMNKILRKTFVEFYSQPILENLLECFQKSFPNIQFPPIPERGNFQLDEVLTSPYFLN